MEEFTDKNDVETAVLGDNASLQSHLRFPKDEAVLARFGKKQQFRVSFYPYALFFEFQKQAKPQLSVSNLPTNRGHRL